MGTIQILTVCIYLPKTLILNPNIRLLGTPSSTLFPCVGGGVSLVIKGTVGATLIIRVLLALGNLEESPRPYWFFAGNKGIQSARNLQVMYSRIPY